MIKHSTVVKTIGIISILLSAGCTWNDDYRSRQPDVLQKEEVKTSNVSSPEYVNMETNQNLRNPPPQSMPSVDELSHIPEIIDVR